MCTKLSSWSISSTFLPEPVASGANADSGFGGSPRSAWNSAAALTWHSRSSAAGSESNQAGGADPHFGEPILHPDGADGEPGVDAAVEIDRPDRTGIPAARRTLIVRDELHRPHSPSTGHRHRRGMGQERIERVEAGAQHAFDMIDGMKQL